MAKNYPEKSVATGSNGTLQSIPGKFLFFYIFSQQFLNKLELFKLFPAQSQALLENSLLSTRKVKGIFAFNNLLIPFNEVFFPDCQLDSRKYFLQNDRRLTVTWIVFNTIRNECLNEYVSITLMSADCHDFAECSIESGPILVKLFSYTFEEPLKLCKSYVYVIRSLWNSKSKRFRVNPVYPKIDEIEMIEGDDHKSMNISWKYPEESNCPKNFKFEARGENLIYRLEPSTSFVSFMNELRPCENYEFSVSPVVDGEVLPEYGITTDYTLNKTTPSQVTNLTANYDEETQMVDLKWLHSDVDTKCIEGYNIYVESDYDTRQEFTVSTNVYIRSIVSCITYRFRVAILTVYQLETGGTEINVTIPSRGEM